MYAFICGELTDVTQQAVTLACQGIGYEINVGENLALMLAQQLQLQHVDSHDQVAKVTLRTALADTYNSTESKAQDIAVNGINHLDIQHLKLYTTLIVREDAQLLYGFLNKQQKLVFELLLTIPRIGAKLALAICDHLSADQLVLAVLQQDVKALTAIKGLGPKVGQRLLLDLKEKLQKLQAVLAPSELLALQEGAPSTTKQIAGEQHADIGNINLNNEAIDQLSNKRFNAEQAAMYDDVLSALLVLNFSLPESKRRLKRSFDPQASLEANLRAALNCQ